jgi:hypothetical protein
MPAYSRTKIRKFLLAADAASTSDAKGTAFEDLVCYLFEKIPGITISHRDEVNRFGSEEVDIAFWNEQHPKGLKAFGAFLLVECKNWSGTVGCPAVRDFLGKLRNRGLDFGILIAANGVTGSPGEGDAAHHEVSLALAAKLRMIVITRAEMEGLKTSDELVTMIKRKVCQLIGSGTVWP